MSANFLMDLVAAKGVTVALLSAGAIAVMEPEFTYAGLLQASAIVALGVSMGDVILTIGGVGSKVETYVSSPLKSVYLDPSDFLAGAVGFGILNYLSPTMEMMPGIAIAAVAGGIAPTVASFVVSSLAKEPEKPAPAGDPIIPVGVQNTLNQGTSSLFAAAMNAVKTQQGLSPIAK